MAIDLFVCDNGQSNDYSFTGYEIAGAPGTNGSFSGSDQGLKINSPFAAVLFNQLSNQSPATAPAVQTFQINTGDIALQNFAAVGQFNAGHEQAARLLVSLGIATNPYWAKMAIGSTSVPGHWAKASGFPAGASPTLYQQRITYFQGRIATAGRNPDVWIHRIGETDAATPARVVSAPTDLKQWYDDTFTDLGISINTPIIAVYLSQRQAAGDPNGYNAAMDTWAANDPRVSLIKVDDLFLRADPHWAFNQQWEIGQRIVIEIWRRLRPGVSLNRGTGPLPYYQAAGPLCTAQASPTPSQPDAGERPQAGDLDVAYALSYTAATTHTFTQPATGTTYTQLGTEIDSTSGASHQRMSVWYRILAASDIDSAGRTVGPSITFGTATINRAKRKIYRNVNPVTPIAGFLTGVNNAITTSLTIGAAPVTVPAGCLAVALIGSAKSGGGQVVTNVTSAGFASAYTSIYDGEANSGSGFAHSAFGVAPISGTSLQPATVTFGTAAINAGFLLALSPMLVGAGVADAGPDQGEGTGLMSLNGDGVASLAADQASASGIIALAGAGQAALAADQGSGTALIGLFGDGQAALAPDQASGTGLMALVGTGVAELAPDQASGLGLIAEPPPFTYSSVEDATQAIGTEALRQLSDLDNLGIVDGQRVIAAILCADGIINSYIGKRYAVPLAEVPESIATLSCNWALRILRQRAFKVQPLQEDIEQDKVDREWLSGIAGGTISLGIEPRPAKASDRIDVGQALRETSRDMSLRRMKGFI